MVNGLYKTYWWIQDLNSRDTNAKPQLTIIIIYININKYLNYITLKYHIFYNKFATKNQINIIYIKFKQFTQQII